MECTNPATMRTFIAILAKTNIIIKERARRTTCKTKEQAF